LQLGDTGNQHYGWQGTAVTLAFCLVLLFVGSNELSEQPAPTSGAWYHLFYSLDPKSLSTGGWPTVKKWRHPLPVGGPYDCADAKTIARQVNAMRDVGIRFIVFDHTNTVHVDNDQIDSRIRAWYDWMDKQPKEKRLLLTISAGGELNQHSNRDAWQDASDYPPG
jgi:hypothetical protein